MFDVHCHVLPTRSFPDLRPRSHLSASLSLCLPSPLLLKFSYNLGIATSLSFSGIGHDAAARWHFVLETAKKFNFTASHSGTDSATCIYMYAYILQRTSN